MRQNRFGPRPAGGSEGPPLVRRAGGPHPLFHPLPGKGGRPHGGGAGPRRQEHGPGEVRRGGHSGGGPGSAGKGPLPGPGG